MDLSLTADQQQFRRDVCELLREDSVKADSARAFYLAPDIEPSMPDVYRRLGERGWLAVNWPTEYGGLGKSIAHKAILTEELIAHGVPEVFHTLSIDIVGLAILVFGTPEQKALWLPRLARAQSAACVLFTEPDVGSDLAALTTAAEPEAGGWRLRGRKTYSLKAHMADFGLCAARTSPSDVKYHGITVFILPMRTPGVLTEPTLSMSDERFGDVTLAGPLMTPADVLGEVDQGWEVIGRLLTIERTGIELEAKGRRILDTLIERTFADGTMADSPYGERLVELDALLRAGRLLSWRALNSIAAETADAVHGAIAKWHTSETAYDAAALATDICGLTAALTARDEDAPPGWLIESTIRDAPGFTLASGTSEMMLSMIASSVLGLYK
jgi:alkylation response protein AidB-like acyl-CoA dehydrogenase